MSERTGERGNGRLRQLDRVLGIPMIAAIGLARCVVRFRRGALPRSPRVVGLLKASGIGDAVILSGVLRDLRAFFPDAKIVLFSGLSNHAFARLLGGVDRVVPLPVRNPLRALRLVRAERPDVMIDFGMWPRFEAIVASLSGARWVVGVRTPGQHRHFGYDVVVDHSSDHEIVNYRNLVAPFGLASTSLPTIEAGGPNGASEPPRAQPYAVLHLWPGGSNAAERSWPAERWLALARALAERGCAIVLTGGPDDVSRTRELVDRWAAAGRSAVSIAGSTPEETVVWLRHARGVVSVNTGLLHLAAAVGAPTIAINGPTSGRRWGPLGRYTRCVSSPVVPEGYLNLGWERDERFARCMEAIAPAVVLAAWDELMAEVDVAGARTGASVDA